MKIKIISCLIFGVIFSNIAMGQESRLKNVTDIDLKIAKKSDLANMKGSKIGKSKFSTINRLEANSGEIYELDGMFLQLNGASEQVKSDHLEQWSKGLKEMNGWAPAKVFTTKIDTFGNYKVLVVNFEYEDEQLGKYTFYSVTKDSKKVLNGILEYDVAEREKAAKTIDRLIKSIKFK